MVAVTERASFKHNMKTPALLLLAITFGVAEGAISWPEGLGFHCLLPCFESFAPVCGSDGKTLRTFDNSCKLRRGSCWTKKAFFEIKLGECTLQDDARIFDESGACLLDWDPVCGTDDVEIKTFPNLCFLHTFNMRNKQYFHLIDTTQCEQQIAQKQSEKDCPACTKILWPVCGGEDSALVTFPNECVMRSYNCMESRNFTEVKSGECQERSPQ